MRYALLLALYLISAAVCIFTALFFAKKLNVKSKPEILLLVSLLSLWAVIDCLDIVYTSEENKFLLTNVGYIAYALLAPCWFSFVMSFTKDKSQLKNPFLIILYSIFAVFILLNWFNPGNSFYKSYSIEDVGGYTVLVLEYGIAFWVYMCFTVITLLSSMAWLFYQTLRGNLKKHFLLLLSSALLLPLILDVLYVFKIVPNDLAPIGFIYCCIAFFLLNRNSFFAKMPLSHGSIINNMTTGYILLSSGMRVLEINSAAKKLFYLSGTGNNQKIENLILNEWQISPLILASSSLLKTFTAPTQAVHNYRISANKISSAGGKDFYLALFIQDETALHASRERIMYLERYDEATGLFNHNYFMELLEKDVYTCKERGTGAVVLGCIQIMNYRNCCQLFGSDIGNLLMHVVGQTIRDAIRNDDVICRFSTDEIYVFQNFENTAHLMERVEDIIKSVLYCFEKPVDIDGYKIELKLNVGVAFAPKHADTGSRLVSLATMARRNITKYMKSPYCIYHERTGDSFARIFKLESEMSAAIEQGQFFLMYQPQVDISCGKIIGVEALVRWKHPELGPISPADFIPIAEENGIIYKLGLFVIKEAVGQQRQWQSMGVHDVRVSVNVSINQLTNANFATDVLSVVDKSGIKPHNLELEITESIALFPEAMAYGHLPRLRERGIRIAMDDFGMGHSSLAYIKDFEPDTIKIDRVLSNDILTNHTSIAMIQSVRMLCESLGIETVVEYIEHQEQLKVLRDLKCDIVQGYIFSPPLLAIDCTNYILNSGIRKRARIKY